MKSFLVILAIFSLATTLKAQDYWEEWDDYSVDQFYVKQDLPSGTLDEDGDDIDHVFIEASLKSGTYEVEIADESGNLYHMKGTDYYVTFRGYYGYAGYGDEGILDVSGYKATFYKRP